MGTYHRSYVAEHGAGWRYKRAVPKDLRHVVAAPHWTKYLGQIGKPEALVQARALAAEHDRLIAAVRKLTPQERAEIGARGGLARARGVAAAAEGVGNMLAHLARVEIDLDDDIREQAEIVKEARRDSARMRADADKLQKIVRRATPGAGGTLDALIEAWQRVTQPRGERQVNRMRLYAGRFLATVGALSPMQVTSAHARAWRDALEKDTTLSHVVAAQHSVCQTAPNC